ncbi:MAG: TIGR04013 family B12-binding domain/radical SAM domain-containing protein [Candidatus Helarchaeota archaeon]|nr:TIGR04013 family B12-binding domain/radical SAM domain-containing protein [Candidatus Helarchaeota archaeon]
MKKFALIGCFSSKNWYGFAPLFATLEKTSIIHMDNVFILKKRTNSALKKILDQFNTSIFAYSFYTHEAPRIAAEIKRITEIFSHQNIIFIAGGPHASGNPSQTLQMGFDLVVKGEGERTFPTLLERLCTNQSYLDIEGICFRKQDQIHLSTPSTVIKLDEYPTFSSNFNLYPPLEITRGCPFGCKYCEVTYHFGNKMRHRSINTILNIVKEYHKIFTGRRSTDIRFISPNSLAYGSHDGKTPNPAKIRQLLKSIYELGKDNIRIFFASFPSETRPEFVTSSLLEEITPFISNTHIAFGAQSGSDKILKLIGRQHTVQDIQNATTAILEANLTPLIDFLLGLPDEEIEDQYQTMDLIKELIGQKAQIRIHYFMPLAGTPFENAIPVPIEPEILSELGRFAKKGYLQGNLDTQIKNSNRILKFLQSFNNR